MQDLKTWSYEVGEQNQAFSRGDIRYYRFMRDPPRSRRIDPRCLFSPADGVIIHATVVGPDEPIEVKGEGYTVRDLLSPMEAPDEPLCVVGIFMTFYDVHINRMPTMGSVKWAQAEPIKSYNRPMLFVENDILDDRMLAAYEGENAYMRDNARCVNRITVDEFSYHVVQIADLDIDVITPFASKQGQWFRQGDRFSFVRWGSQVELIVPECFAEIVIPESVHVEGATDRLMEFV